MKPLPTVHPFPARMASSIVFEELSKESDQLTVVDPMAGSGTSIVAARLRGHRAFGFDVDPLAVLLAAAWARDFVPSELQYVASRVLKNAERRYKYMKVGEAYPASCDDETRKYLRFWFDPTVRRQLTALSLEIEDCDVPDLKILLWCAFSRLIITKRKGVSLAMDVSHSRPHKVYKRSPITPLDHFQNAIARVIKGSPFAQNTSSTLPKAVIGLGDARRLSLSRSCVDLVVSSPPYLNAIDYLRGHRLSLVWMGHSLASLRSIRSTSIGSENGGQLATDEYVSEVFAALGFPSELPNALRRMLIKYIDNMTAVLSEIRRILRPGGNAILVIGDSTTRGVFVSTSGLTRVIAELLKFNVRGVCKRSIPDNRRYLPAPTYRKSGSLLGQRMRSEVVLKLSI